jgi:hypothetical protein
MAPEHLRDGVAIAAIFGFFACSWFGWAQEAPPLGWLRWLRIGVLLSLLTTIAGGVLVQRHWADGTVFDDRTSPRFGIVVGIEVLLAAAGALLLARRGRSELTSAWIAFVVGAHFVPLAIILKIPALHVVAVLLVGAAGAGVRLARLRSITVSAAVGLLAGMVLLGSALLALAGALLR